MRCETLDLSGILAHNPERVDHAQFVHNNNVYLVRVSIRGTDEITSLDGIPPGISLSVDKFDPRGYRFGGRVRITPLQFSALNSPQPFLSPTAAVNIDAFRPDAEVLSSLGIESSVQRVPYCAGVVRRVRQTYSPFVSVGNVRANRLFPSDGTSYSAFYGSIAPTGRAEILSAEGLALAMSGYYPTYDDLRIWLCSIDRGLLTSDSSLAIGPYAVIRVHGRSRGVTTMRLAWKQDHKSQFVDLRFGVRYDPEQRNIVFSAIRAASETESRLVRSVLGYAYPEISF